jgi:hypothetical protein
MVWGFLLAFTLCYPAVELVEDWRIRRHVNKELADMRKHTSSGHRFDATLGHWIG